MVCSMSAVIYNNVDMIHGSDECSSYNNKDIEKNVSQGYLDIFSSNSEKEAEFCRLTL